MNTPAKVARTNKALQVIQHINADMTVVNACREVGIPRSTFYSICNKNPELMAEVQEMIGASEREQLMMILFAKTKLLELVIRDGLAGNTKPNQRLAIYKELVKRVDELMENLRRDSHNNKDDLDFLNGPKLKPGVSRYPASYSIMTSEDPP